MRRVASLYLPFLPTDRIRQARAGAPRPSRPAPPPDGAPPPSPDPDGGLYLGDECSCPRGGHWRPGARWAENSKERRLRVEAEIAQLPLHQRPAMRELGRRSEPAEMPFKATGRGIVPLQERSPSPASAEGGPRKATVAPVSPFPARGTNQELIVTVARSGQQVTLAAVCRNALAAGLAPGMPLTQARVLVPGLNVHDADPIGDRALLDRIGRFAARRITPLAAVSGPDGLWLDLTGAAHLHGGEQRLAHELLRFCSKLGLGARIAVAGHGAAAHALARHGPERLHLCPPGGEEPALAPLPLAALRLEQGIIEALRRLGIERVGALIAMPRAPLARRFGKATLNRIDQALGRAAEPFDAIIPYDAPMATMRFAEPIGGAEPIAAAIADLTTQLVDRLREAGLGARALLLLCDRVDRQVQRIEVGASRATRDPAHWLRLLGRHIETIDPGFGIDAMRLVAVRTEPLGATALPHDLAAPTPTPDLAQLVDLIVSRIGPRRLYRLSAQPSDVPERSVRRVAPLAAPEPWPDAWPRPPRLLPNPEPIANVIAELPDAPPRRFSWRGKTYRLAKGDGPERIYGEWWKRDAERDAVRDYFWVEDEGGGRFWLFRRGDGRDPRTGDLSWWIQGACG